MKAEVSSVAKASEQVLPDALTKLREVFPQFVKDGQVDFDALRAFMREEGMLAGPEKYGLSWAGKSDAFRAIRVPATGTLTPQKDESKDWDTTQNLFIEGDNLEVLKLLQKHYRGQIKMIYIDPPYNTGKDFVYKDNFTENKSDYYERTGQTESGIKMTANTEQNGRFHSDWLTMMYPRLFLAKNLLRDDGVIFISIDDNEVANLRLIMDEIFGEENFISALIWKRRQMVDSRTQTGISSDHEYTLVYMRNETRLRGKEKDLTKYSNPNNDPRGPWMSADMTGLATIDQRPNLHYPLLNPETNVEYLPPENGWRYSRDTMQRLIQDNRVIWPSTPQGRPRLKKYLNDLTEEFTGLSSILDTVFNTQGTRELKDIFEGKEFFDFPKPTEYLKVLIQQGSSVDQGDIILDFFAGSGTTAHAVMAQNDADEGNRKWISVQLPEETGEDSEARKAGFKTIADISRERIRRAGEKIGKGDIGFKSLKLTASNYSQWQTLTSKDNEEKFKEQSKLFIEHPLVAGYSEESVVYEVLLKEGFDLNAVVTPSTVGGLKIWTVTDTERKLVVTFVPKLTRDQVDALHLAKEDTFVCLDSALDDSLKVNIARSVLLKTI